MAPKASASSKGKGKAKIVVDPEELSTTDQAQSQAQASRKLAHMYRLAFRHPDVVTTRSTAVDDQVFDDDPTLLLKWKQMGALPLWLEECPAEHQAAWGSKWAGLHEKLDEMSQFTTVTKVNQWKWKDNGLDLVAQLARQENWDRCLDEEIEQVLDGEGKGIRTTYCTTYMYKRMTKIHDKDTGAVTMKGFIPPAYWDSATGVLIPKVLGVAIEHVTPEILEWWHAILASILDARSKQRTRLDKKKAGHLNAVMKLMGEGMWQFQLPEGLTLAKAERALVHLRELKACLMWLPVSEEDLRLQREPIDVDSEGAAERIKARWEKMSEFAQHQEWTQMMLGYMMGLVSRKVEQELNVDFGDDSNLFDYGVCLAKAVPAPTLNARFLQPDEEEVRRFHKVVVDFADMWNGRSHPESLDTAVGLYFNPEYESAHDVWAEEGKNIGTSGYQRMTPEQLHTYLGFTDGRPLTFRKHTADDPQSIVSQGETAFPGSSPVIIAWHQLGFVHFLFMVLGYNKLTDGSGIHHSAGADKAPIAIQHKWGTVPGLCLFDEVGLGKTVCAMTAIGTLQNIYALQDSIRNEPDEARKALMRSALPACVKGAATFATVEDCVPNRPHLILVPPSLLDQWGSELKRFMRTDRIRLVVVSTKATEWEKDMANIRAPGVLGIQIVVLATHNVLKRMYRENKSALVHAEVDGNPRLVYRPPAKTLFSFSWTTAWVDEVHDARKGTMLWKSIRALFECTLIKVTMTATPLMESPSDLYWLAKLTSPPGMSLGVHAEIAHLIRDLRLVRAKTNATIHQEAMKLSEQESIADSQTTAASRLLAQSLVRLIQRHLVPYMIRRGPATLNWEGQRLNTELPPRTIVHVAIEVTDNERNDSFDGLEQSVAIKKFDVDTHGAFFLKGRQVLTIPTPLPAQIEHMDRETFMALAPTKVRCMLEFIVRNLTQGPESYISADFHGTEDKITDTTTMGLSDLIKEWNLEPVDPAVKKSDEKTIVYTYFQAHHDFLIRGFKLFGINAVSINGSLPAGERTRIIQSFKSDPAINVLVMSTVGLTGLNLTCARNLIVLETGWSAVQSQQLYGRIYRRGQKRETNIVLLFAKDTVDVFMVANGLGKGRLLQDFLTLDRSKKSMRILAGQATTKELEELEAVVGGDEEAAKELVTKLPQAKSAVAKKVRETAKEPSPKKRGKRKRAEEETDPEDEEKAENPEETPKAKRSRKKTRSKAVVSSDSETEKPKKKRTKKAKQAGSLAPGPSQAGSSNSAAIAATPHPGVASTLAPVADSMATVSASLGSSALGSAPPSPPPAIFTASSDPAALLVSPPPIDSPVAPESDVAPQAELIGMREGMEEEQRASQVAETDMAIDAAVVVAIAPAVESPSVGPSTSGVAEEESVPRQAAHGENWAVASDGSLLDAEEMGPWPNSPSDEPSVSEQQANIEEARLHYAQLNLERSGPQWLRESSPLTPLPSSSATDIRMQSPEPEPSAAGVEVERPKPRAVTESRKSTRNPVQPQAGPSMGTPQTSRSRGKPAPPKSRRR
ncbi:hypothetical protein D9757_015129 [Collybiopsis confluens]|uniref:Helicase C-terminal domain-containing protein n=1 Tax=Collybiopsis confluens TaxID=2823264 RepID=A0A8H5CG27_9AGAR|nr:hypothetical protein D9757_015129 [Collybiopsis confluens]